MDFNAVTDRRISDIIAWWDHVQQTTSSNNGVFTCKLMIRQYAYWKSRGFDLLSSEWDRILWIHRNNFVEQALSLAKARLTDQWHADQASKGNGKELVVSKRHILQAMAELAAWEEYFEKHLAKHVHDVYQYEDFCRSPKLFAEALSKCGFIPSTNRMAKPLPRVQRTDADSFTASEFSHWLKSKLS